MLADDLRDLSQSLIGLSEVVSDHPPEKIASALRIQARLVDAIAARLEGRAPMTPDSRERCKCCGRANPVGFHISNEVWAAAVPEDFRHLVLCIMCFDQFATERGMDWSAHPILWSPVSGTAALLDKEAGADAG